MADDAQRAPQILIASLFLPKSVNLSPSGSPGATPSIPSTPKQRAVDVLPLPKITPSSIINAPVAKLRSIVEDLTVKATTPLSTPAYENPNPFASPFPTTAKSPAITPARAPSSFLNPSGSTAAAFPGARRSRSPGGDLLLTTNSKSADGSPTNSVPATPTSPASASLGRRMSRNFRSTPRRNNSVGMSSNDGRNIVSPWEMHASAHGNIGLHKALASVKDEVPDVKWVGVLDTPTDKISDELKKDIDEKLGAADNIPVWVKDEEFNQCYDVFCHQVLWPSLHYALPDAPKTSVVYESSSFAQYKSVNQKFADAIVANYREGDTVWVNDYHLCLVPQLVRAKLPDAPIGFFLHVAWPSTEIFRCLAVREQLLYGLLGSDLIGFQTYNYARHFRQTCSRILSLEALPKGIQLEHSFVDVAIFPIGIDVADLTKKRKDPEVAEWAASIRQRYEGKKLIVGRDKLDEVSGVRHKIAAFETFLERYPKFRDQVVLIQVALATTERNELQASITDVVSRVNSRYGSLTYQPVVLLHTHDITFPMYLGLLTAADAFMVTSLREGMALRTHEFVECQHERKRPLLLSEFTGSYSYSGFRSCIAINPWDYRNTADAIHQALTMDDEEAASRWQDLHSHVVTQTAQSFVTSFLTRLTRVHAEHVRRNPLSIPILPSGAISPRYAAAQQALFLIDFESTLWVEDPRVTKEQGFVPPKRAVELLKELVGAEVEIGGKRRKKNEVWVLSGLPVKDHLERLAEAVPGLGIVAENGCFLKAPNATEWTSTISRLSIAWKPICVEILGYFTERTPGSFVEERGASVVWRFGSSHSKDDHKVWGKRAAAEAQNHIWDSLGERFALRIIPGATSFLVLPRNVSRSVAVGSILKHDNASSLLATATAAAASKTSISLSPASPVPTYSTLPPPSSPTQAPAALAAEEDIDAMYRPTAGNRNFSHTALPSHFRNHTYGSISTPTALPSAALELEHTNANTPLAPGTPVPVTRSPGSGHKPSESIGTDIPPSEPPLEDTTLPATLSTSLFARWTKYDFILTISGDEPLIRRMNQLPQAGGAAVVETASTSGKGSDANWRLDVGGEGVVSLLEELVHAKPEEEGVKGADLLKGGRLELDDEDVVVQQQAHA